MGRRLNGHEPRQSRRQLEQRRHELPPGQPQQQQPVEPQQQHRFPACFARSSRGDGFRRLTRPPSRVPAEGTEYEQKNPGLVAYA